MARTSRATEDSVNVEQDRTPSEQCAKELLLCNSPERPDALLMLLKRYSPTDGWKIIAEQWSGCDAIPHDQFRKWFRKNRKHWYLECMRVADRAFYTALPSTFTVFRGADTSSPLGLSWTLSQSVAARFAIGHRWIVNPQPVVWSATVEKSNVAFVTSERNEMEVVLFAPPKKSVVEGKFLSPVSLNERLNSMTGKPVRVQLLMEMKAAATTALQTAELRLSDLVAVTVDNAHREPAKDALGNVRAFLEILAEW